MLKLAKHTYNSFTKWVYNVLYDQVYQRKLNSPLGYMTLLFVSLVIAVGVAKIHFLVGIGIVAGLIGIATVFACLFETKLGFYLSTGVSFFVFYLNRMVNDALPVGILIDVMIFMNFTGIYFRKTLIRERYWQYSKNPITYIYFIYLAFMLVEAFNPSMYSIGGWIFAFRKYLNFMMIYFVALHVFESFDDVKQFFKIWLSLCALSGFYGVFQQWVGLLPFEEYWVVSDPLKYRLYFQGGTIRKFSFLSDPTSYGILMASTALSAIALAMGPVSKKHRRYLLIGALGMMLGMAFSGTRTAYAMLPAGLVLYIMMTITSRKTLAFAIISTMVFVVVIFGPFHSNGTINRIRSTFQSEDESLNVRDVNRHYIQPYIWRHPLGGGMSTSGVGGEIYNPGHPLAGFPPDSGFLKTALEAGWVGLILGCILYFIVMQTGIRQYYRTRNPELRTYYLAIMVNIFSMIIANYAQVAIGQIPGAFMFYGSLAMIIKLRSFDTNTQTENKSVLNKTELK
ncbi:O-antigen ligase-like membrane protein [Chitinophaga skermanii]|uniref:O-antigen ligase-like membrane protein n=1 Tax=Chitinophaga skermanii TaxID=331697 RepID=A0A327QSK9_9BACT|nr:O-antigen ligase family protein [Chitinophaga skermanii]RAJ06938.1 O-antigen ligase-like membrane protein [Chitinophaga skermanii]